ncbi:MAG: GEVED domain-containing protein [Bacteroidota bacterium]
MNFNTQLYYFGLLMALALFSSNTLLAQSAPCGTPPPTAEEIRFTLEHIAPISVPRRNGTTGIPIQIHIVQDAGSGGPSEGDLAKALANLNAYHAEADIEFFYKAFPNYVSDTDLYEFNADQNGTDLDTEADLRALFTTATDAVNIYFVNSIVTSSGFNACGYASFPSNNILSNRIVMANGCLLNGPNGTFVHEFGHYFNLYHTHQGTDSGPNGFNAENVARTGANANCGSRGDLLCGTEADPRYNNNNFNFGSCIVPNPGTDIHGETYEPPVANIMSYYPDFCGGHYTADQYTRMEQALIVRQGHTAYSIDASPMSVAVPTDLSAVVDEPNNAIILNWTDVANNEMGYIVERSTTSSTSGFLALENVGVGSNAVTISDNTVESFNTYWYRIKPVNGDKDTYSNVVEIDVDLFYCGVSSTDCDEYISRVQIGAIDNSSDCTPGGYQNHTDESTIVEIGTSYSITVTNGNPYPQDECGIYVDWNQDGDFFDANETISVSGNPGAGPYNATITPPAGALVGDTRMRIRITYNQSSEPCNNHRWGESEDYTLNVQAVFPVDWLSFSGKPTEEQILLDWSTASEEDNDYFVIERLHPDQQKFIALGERAGNGTVAITQNYAWIDRAPLSGTNYYRIKQVDFDGSFSYSETIAVNWEGKDLVQLFPNPASDQVQLRLNRLWEDDLQIVLTNSLGQQHILTSTAFGDYERSIDVSSLRSGVYYLQIRSSAQVISGQWFTKQ